MIDGLDNELEDWNTLSDQHDWSGLVLGNGFSQNIWKRFGYTSLFETAASASSSPFSRDDIALFGELDTRNFEQVLSALNTARRVALALSESCCTIDAREHSIRTALIHAVHSVHIPWVALPILALDAVCAEFVKFESIYCTNYDLLPYWAMMQDQDAFRDYLWSDHFNMADTGIWGKKTKVHFLHGGLHLCQGSNGETFKRKAEGGRNLLDSFGTYGRSVTPLFISEGSADDKLISIRKSDYLTFMFSQFVQDPAPLVIFGHSLGETDQHIVDAIDSHGGRQIAVSVHAEGNIRKKKAALIKALPNASLSFFDAATHPLGSADLRIEEPVK
jgi:hypothetical protein